MDNQKIEPIKDQKEFDEVLEKVADMAVTALNISRRAATMRIIAIKQSGIMSLLGSPDETVFQFVIDMAMRIPQLGDENDNKVN